MVLKDLKKEGFQKMIYIIIADQIIIKTIKGNKVNYQWLSFKIYH